MTENGSVCYRLVLARPCRQAADTTGVIIGKTARLRLYRFRYKPCLTLSVIPLLEQEQDGLPWLLKAAETHGLTDRDNFIPYGFH